MTRHRSSFLFHSALANLRLPRAWMFAAGLILGFSMFAQGETKFEMDAAFNGAREVLKKLSENSPQAEHYYEILTGFADAIQRHRQHLSREKRRSNNKYVSQLLTLDVNPSGTGSPQATFSPRTPSRDLADGMSAETPAPDGERLSEFDYQAAYPLPDTTQFPMEGGGFDFGLFGWDNFAMQISENFVFENDPSWGMA